MRIGTYYRYKLLNKLGIFNNTGENAKILDIGGFDGFTLSKLKAKSKILIDPDAKEEFSNIKYLKKDFFSHDFKNEKFDFILSLDVLEHLLEENESKYFSKIHSLLETNGKAIITTPSKDIKTFPNFLRDWIGKKWGHYKCLGYTKEELEKLIRLAKIKNYEIYSYHSRHYLNNYLLVRFFQIILPETAIQKILAKMANKDAQLERGLSKGYWFVRIRK
jgi:2-polyprenyl-3-methyl-5-hydroxy-6-metoxy-1,4-benzoquinol methylase